MTQRGRASLDFGTHPGSASASIAISVPGISSTEIPRAWLLCEATSDHSADEHSLEPISVTCTGPTAGVGFTITGVLASRGEATTTYGLWRVAWEV